MTDKEGVGKGLHLRTGVGCFYSPSCREEVFSETPVQPSATLCIRSGAKTAFSVVRCIMLPQDVVVPNKDAAVALEAVGVRRARVSVSRPGKSGLGQVREGVEIGGTVIGKSPSPRRPQYKGLRLPAQRS